MEIYCHRSWLFVGLQSWGTVLVLVSILGLAQGCSVVQPVSRDAMVDEMSEAQTSVSLDEAQDLKQGLQICRRHQLVKGSTTPAPMGVILPWIHCMEDCFRRWPYPSHEQVVLLGSLRKLYDDMKTKTPELDRPDLMQHLVFGVWEEVRASGEIQKNRDLAGQDLADDVARYAEHWLPRLYEFWDRHNLLPWQSPRGGYEEAGQAGYDGATQRILASHVGLGPWRPWLDLLRDARRNKWPDFSGKRQGKRSLCLSDLQQLEKLEEWNRLWHDYDRESKDRETRESSQLKSALLRLQNRQPAPKIPRTPQENLKCLIPSNTSSP